MHKQCRHTLLLLSSFTAVFMTFTLLLNICASNVPSPPIRLQARLTPVTLIAFLRTTRTLPQMTIPAGTLISKTETRNMPRPGASRAIRQPEGAIGRRLAQLCDTKLPSPMLLSCGATGASQLPAATHDSHNCPNHKDWSSYWASDMDWHSCFINEPFIYIFVFSVLFYV